MAIERIKIRQLRAYANGNVRVTAIGDRPGNETAYDLIHTVTSESIFALLLYAKTADQYVWIEYDDGPSLSARIIAMVYVVGD